MRLIQIWDFRKDLGIVKKALQKYINEKTF